MVGGFNKTLEGILVISLKCKIFDEEMYFWDQLSVRVGVSKVFVVFFSSLRIKDEEIDSYYCFKPCKLIYEL